MRRLDLAPLAALVAVTAIWGYTFVPVQEAVAVYPLFTFLAARFAVSTAVLAPFAWRPLLALPRAGLVAGCGAGCLLAAAYGLQTAGLELTTVSSTGFITGLYVVATPLIALALFRTPVPALAWAGVVLSLAGLLMLSGVPGGSTLGNALGVFAGALGYLVATWVQSRTTAARAALVFTLEAPFAAVFGVLLLSERLGWLGWAGCAVMLAGIVLAEPAAAGGLRRLVPPRGRLR